MNYDMKKYLFPLISLLIAISCRGEVNDTFVEGHLVYKIISEIDHEVAVNDVDTPIIGDFSIPSEVIYEGVNYTVRTICTEAFKNSGIITSLIIPDSVTEIETRAFEGCIDMHSIVIGKGLKTIHEYAFIRCDNLKEVIFNAQACNNSSRTFLPSNVESLVFGEDVEIIPPYICSGLKKITSINIPNSVKEIRENAFRYCKELNSIVVGREIKSIGDYAFDGCNNLKEVIFEADSCEFLSSYASFPSSVERIEFGENVKIIPSFICSGCDNITSINIPNSVTTIGQQAFSLCSRLNTLHLSSVKTIGDAAFLGCDALETLVIPNSVTKIEGYAFYGCDGLRQVEISNSLETLSWSVFEGCVSLQSVSIPPSVITIEEKAFFGCTNLRKVEIPNSINTIGSYAFEYCSGLETLLIPNSVTTIKNHAFYGCSGLKTVLVGTSVTSIEMGAFYNCESLVKYAYPKHLEFPQFKNGIGVAYDPDGAILEDDWIYNIEKNEIRFAPYYISGKYTIPETITSIGDNAFTNCTGITDLIIPDWVTYIGNRAFKGCERLRSVSIGKNANYFGYGVFDECSDLKISIFNAERCVSEPNNALFPSSLESITFGENVKSIPALLCKDCNKLTAIHIPNSVTTIEESAFAGCSHLWSIEFSNSLTTIEKYAFECCSSLDKLVIPSSLISIGELAFYGCSGIKTLELPNSLTTIGDGAFYGCSGLETLEIPNSVTTIGTEAFYNCSGLKSVLIGNSVKMIGRDAFNRCTSLIKSAYPKTVESSPFNRGVAVAYNPDDYIIEDGWIWNSDKSKILFVPYYFSGEYTIPDNVTAIAESAFAGCDGLTSITISDSIIDIGEKAFADCRGLIYVEVGRGVKSLNKSTFTGCIKIKDVVFEAANCQYSSKSTSRNSIFPSNLETIKFGNNVKSIPAFLCMSCRNLTSISFPRSLQSVGERAFSNCTGIKSLEIGNSVTTLGYGAFEYCTQLSSVKLSNSLTRIGSSAFEDCYNLKEIILPPSVSKIGSNAFNACLSLEKIIMGNVTTINGGAFANVKPGRIFITAPMPPALGMHAFLWEEDVEWYEDLLLCVQDEAAKEAYMTSKYDWNLISDISTMIVPTVFKMKETTISGEPGDQVQLNATLEPEDVTLPYIFWRSTNPEVATVDHNGLVTIHNNSSDVMFFEGGNDPQECKIIAETLYPNVPIIEIPVISETTTGMMDIDIEDSVDSDLTPENSCIVYNLNGIRVAESTDNLQPGIYIVRKGKKVNKIIVK